jgi:hypothetical protein
VEGLRGSRKSGLISLTYGGPLRTRSNCIPFLGAIPSTRQSQVKN